MAREFIAPGNIFTGAGALDMAEDKLSQLGKKALIVTDNVMVELGNCAKVEAALKNGNVDYVVYHEINGEPTDVMINKGLELYKENGCDFLVALGGGSPIDSMKAIAALVANGKDHRWGTSNNGCNPNNSRYRIRSNTVYDHHRYTK